MLKAKSVKTPPSINHLANSGDFSSGPPKIYAKLVLNNSIYNYLEQGIPEENQRNKFWSTPYQDC